MPLKSDIEIDSKKFDPDTVSEQARAFNEIVVQRLEKGPKWFELGAPTYRQLRNEGKTLLPVPKRDPDALDIVIPSREEGRGIPCGVVWPRSVREGGKEGERKTRGVVVHFHGGGWVFGDEKSTDSLLRHYSEAGDLTVISVGYRHAPEDPFPKGPEDCFDAAEWIFKNAEERYGGPLMFMGGESAGAHLTLLTTFALLKAYPAFTLKGGLLLTFGAYDLSQLPSVHHFSRELILSHSVMQHFLSAFLPNATTNPLLLKSPSVSPFYEDLEPFRGRLPAALFVCGTEDMLLDDSVFMGTKWAMKGGQSTVKIYPGGAHGFTLFPEEMLWESGEAKRDLMAWVRERLGLEG